jgi:hypothetical protein
MLDHATDLERIEQAERETPFCWCGAQTVPVGRPDGVWLICASRTQPKTPLGRLLSLDFAVAHTEHRILAPSILEPAA